MPTEAKIREVEEFTRTLQEARGIVLTHFTGLNVEALSSLRQQCRKEGLSYRVVKNTLAKRAVKASGMEELEALLEGPNAWATHPTDQVLPAKVIAEFAKTHEHLKVRAGFMDGRVLSVGEVEALAKLPTRPVLLGQVAGCFSAPMSSFAGVLAAMLRGFVSVVDAYREKRASSEGAS